MSFLPIAGVGHWIWEQGCCKLRRFQTALKSGRKYYGEFEFIDNATSIFCRACAQFKDGFIFLYINNSEYKFKHAFPPSLTFHIAA
jgi:hypothetical protein